MQPSTLRSGEVGAGWWVCWASLRSAQPTGGAGFDLWFLVKNRRWPNVCMESLGYKNHEN